MKKKYLYNKGGILLLNIDYFTRYLKTIYKIKLRVTKHLHL